jgi:1-acyl-sn-glycerol-3-phosphate acyltransferase
MNREYRAYRRVFHILRTVIIPFFRIKSLGRENIKHGPAVYCANHSSNFDPILISFAAGIEHHLHYMGKAELFRIPILGAVLRATGCYPVNRGQNDINAVKRSLTYLKAGEKIAIFPEGTRVRTDEDGDAKRGAVRIADQMSVPVVPVYVPRNKKLFHSYTIVFGAPYLVNPEKKKLSQNEYSALADELMAKIFSLRTTAD